MLGLLEPRGDWIHSSSSSDIIFRYHTPPTGRLKNKTQKKKKDAGGETEREASSVEDAFLVHLKRQQNLFARSCK